ncbi:MAG: penicillin acylase family protein [Nitrospinae bacterium]|nr:penicillin acylase family protein [Nitrospinota bacterium]
METVCLPSSDRTGSSRESPELNGIPEIHSYAQTNIQLYKQLKSVGYSFDEINHVRKAYDLAKELFACLYCPSGKTFLAHVVGVGSILGSLRISSNVVAASLLHDVYKSGDFGEGWNVDQKKSLVRQTIGLETEHYIEKYQDLEWSRLAFPVMGEASKGAGVRITNKIKIVTIDGSEIRVRRTTAGVVELWAHDEIELAKGMGYVHAHDRMVQMMMVRLIGQGQHPTRRRRFWKSSHLAL